MTNKFSGALVVGQSGGPTAAINASLAGVVETAWEKGSFSAVLGMYHGIEGALKEELIDLSQESQETIRRLVGTPASALGSCRHKLKPEEYERIVEVFKAHDVRYFVYIGGNDSMDTAYQVGKLAAETGYEMRVMGVPKTIDNDLARTDHTPGFGSAARYVALATQDAGLDLAAMGTFEDVCILETMGRHAGWLAAASVLGKQDEDDPPHLVYLPENPFDEQKFLADIQKVHQRLGYVMVVASEGIQDAEGQLIGAKTGSLETDEFGHQIVALSAGVGPYLTRLVTEELGLKARYNRPGTCQRSAGISTSRVDLDEAYLVGRTAVCKLLQGESGFMITLEREGGPEYRCTTGLAPLEDVANEEKLMPKSFINEEGNMPTRAFVQYAMPLIGDPLPPYVRLKKNLVTQKTPPWKGA